MRPLPWLRRWSLHSAGVFCIVKRCMSFASRASYTTRPCGKTLARGGALGFYRKPRARLPTVPSFRDLPTVIAAPLFYLLAVVVVVILLGLSKGGFFGLGVMAL